MGFFQALATKLTRLFVLAGGIFLVVLAIVLIAGDSDGLTGPKLLVLAVLAGLGFLLWKLARKSAGSAQPLDAHTTESQVREAIGFMEAVNQAGAFPPAGPRMLLDDPASPILFATDARQLEIVTSTVRNHVGTRVNLGNVPIYLGRSSPVTKQSIKHSLVGELGITASHLIFAAQGKSADIRLDRITSVELYVDGFSVSATGRKTPVVFQVPNPILWSQLVKNVRILGVSGRALPPSGQLKAL